MIVKALKRFLKFYNIRLVRNDSFQTMANLMDRHRKEISVIEMTDNLQSRKLLLDLLPNSKSQTGQDLFALLKNNFKLGGYYVEIGATDGVGISNTLILAQEFQWSGILCEPSSFWREGLLKNRPESRIDTRCCWNTTGDFLEFLESDEKELSTIESFSSSDSYRKIRKRGHSYMVETISLEDLLLQNKAPMIIDFLSIDTEGSEFSILRDFPFDKYKFNCVVIEHNFGPHKSDILDIFLRAGYLPICESVSAQDFWFIPIDI